MKDIRNEEYAEWLEKSLKEIVDFEPDEIAIVAKNKGDIATAYFRCDAADIAMMVGVLEQDGLFMRLKNNRDWIRGLIEDDGE